MKRLPRPTIRLRLTLIYAGLLMLGSIGLLSLNYVLLYDHLNPMLYQAQSGTATRWPACPDSPDLLATSPCQKAVSKTEAPASSCQGPGTAAACAAEKRQPAFAPSGQGQELQARQAKQAAIRQLRDETLANAIKNSGIALAVMAVVALWLGWVAAGRALRPIQVLTARTRQISQENLHERLALRGPRDEVQELADTFDAMTARLELAFASQRRFVADAAHELRTPLTIVRTSIEVAMAKPDHTVPQLEAMSIRVHAATQRTERLLDGLLALARSDSGVIAQEPVDLADALAAAISHHADEADEAGIAFSTDLRHGHVTGDPALLDRLAANLVHNAVRHNHVGGWVQVQTQIQEPHATMTVRNSGPIVPPAEVDHLFEAFHRLDTPRTGSDRGSGLGLAIARSIARAHNSEIIAEALADGGLAVTVWFPLRATTVPPS